MLSEEKVVLEVFKHRIDSAKIVFNEHGDSKPLTFPNTPLPDYYFIRDDGWAIGFPLQYWKVTYDIWKEDYKYAIDVRDKENYKVLTIKEFLKLMQETK